MAINIFQGGTTKRNQANSASASSRATAAKAALSGAAEASDSGNTAVQTSGTLGKVGNFVGKAAGVAAKFLPGVGGVIAKGLSNVLNDPEWWQSVPGDAVTLNEPLRAVRLGSITVTDESLDTVAFRTSIGSFLSGRGTADGGEAVYVLVPTDQMITQYLLPQIRKVVNAVPLQESAAYARVISVNATIYALWRQLLKMRYMLQHGHTYIANLNDTMFPLFQTENAALLDASINRLEEYLRANVRLPHTLCEYLAWRYGRLYKAQNSAKAAIISYDTISWQATAVALKARIEELMAALSADPILQKANSDVYNAYYDHDMMVVIRDDTQMTYDNKEFALRTNCDIRGTHLAVDSEELNPVFIDSSLDIPTAFMASTVSTQGTDFAGNSEILFPIFALQAYIPQYDGCTAFAIAAVSANVPMFQVPDNSQWATLEYRGMDTYLTSANPLTELPSVVLTYMLVFKPLDVYNKDVYMLAAGERDAAPVPFAVDMTSISYDMGLVPNTTIGNEHIYAFANLVDIQRKTSMSYKQAEKLVSKEAAEFVDKLPVASSAPAPTPASSGTNQK